MDTALAAHVTKQPVSQSYARQNELSLENKEMNEVSIWACEWLTEWLNKWMKNDELNNDRLIFSFPVLSCLAMPTSPLWAIKSKKEKKKIFLT